MSTSGQRALQQALREGSLDAVYYFFGEEDLLKEKALRQLIERAVDAELRDFNLDVRGGSDLDAATLTSLLGTPPLMADRRVIVIRDVPALRKDARSALDRYLQSPAKDAVVVLVAPAGSRPDRALEERTTSVEFDAVPAERIPRWIVQHAATELGATITPAAADLLHRSIGSDLPVLASELDKLASYAGGVTIDESTVTAVAGVRHGETLSDLLDRVAARDAAGALRLLPRILVQPKVSAVWIVMMLTIQTLAIAWGRARRDTGVSPSRVEREILDRFRSREWPWPGRPYGEAAKVWAASLEHWTLPSLEHALDVLLATDAALKETRLSSDEQLLSTLVLALCRGDARSVAA